MTISRGKPRKKTSLQAKLRIINEIARWCHATSVDNICRGNGFSEQSVRKWITDLTAQGIALPQINAGHRKENDPNLPDKYKFQRKRRKRSSGQNTPKQPARSMEWLVPVTVRRGIHVMYDPWNGGKKLAYWPADADEPFMLPYDQVKALIEKHENG